MSVSKKCTVAFAHAGRATCFYFAPLSSFTLFLSVYRVAQKHVIGLCESRCRSGTTLRRVVNKGGRSVAINSSSNALSAFLLALHIGLSAERCARL